MDLVILRLFNQLIQVSQVSNLLDFNKMIEFIRAIDKHIDDMFILDAEAFRDFTDELKHHVPDSLGESEFDATNGGILEESPHGLVVGEAPGRGEQVVLHGCDGGHCNLGGEVAHLVLAQPEILLVLLEDDLQGPAHGADPVGLEEAELAVRGDEPAPLALLVPLAEEQPYAAPGKAHGYRPYRRPLSK